MEVSDRGSFTAFSEVAELYPGRPSYSRRILRMLVDQAKHQTERPTFGDIGAGTGATAYALADMGLSGYAVEPDNQMVAVGQSLGESYPAVSWINASGECTGLADDSLDWVCYSTSFHLTNTSEALRESMRILRPHGFFTITFNLPDYATDPFLLEIENKIRDMAPALERAITPAIGQMETYEALLNQYPGLGNCVSLDATEAVPVTEDRYVKWFLSAAARDIQSQVSPEIWNSILQMIAATFRRRQPTSLRYRSTAWHAQCG